MDDDPLLIALRAGMCDAVQANWAIDQYKTSHEACRALGLDLSLLAADSMPGNLAQRNSAMPMTGIDRRRSRGAEDQLWQRRTDDTDGIKPDEFLDGGSGYKGPTLGVQPADFVDSGAEDEDDENGIGDIDGHTLLHMIHLCQNGLLSRDQANGTNEHADFISGLADMLQADADMGGDQSPYNQIAGNFRGSGSSDARSGRRGGQHSGAGDQWQPSGYQARDPARGVGSYGSANVDGDPSAVGRSTPAGGFSNFNGRGSMDKRRSARDPLDRALPSVCRASSR